MARASPRRAFSGEPTATTRRTTPPRRPRRERGERRSGGTVPRCIRSTTTPWPGHIEPARSRTKTAYDRVMARPDDHVYGVLVIGGGPSGSSCAYWLAEAGWERAGRGK